MTFHPDFFSAQTSLQRHSFHPGINSKTTIHLEFLMAYLLIPYTCLSAELRRELRKSGSSCRSRWTLVEQRDRQRPREQTPPEEVEEHEELALPAEETTLEGWSILCVYIAASAYPGRSSYTLNHLLSLHMYIYSFLMYLLLTLEEAQTLHTGSNRRLCSKNSRGIQDCRRTPTSYHSLANHTSPFLTVVFDDFG